MSRALSARGVTVRYGAFEAVRSASVEIGAGEVHALLGPSGCGKTTLLRAIAGFEPIERGEIEVGARLVARAGELALAPERRGIGLVFQDDALFEHLSVARNVAFGAPGTRRARLEAARAELEAVGLRDLGDRSPSALSGGQRQRVGLARALAARPALLLLDEPFANLDPALRARLGRSTRRILAERGVAALMVTHDAAEAMQLADRISVMRAGRIEQAGSARELYERPATRSVALALGAANFIAHAGLEAGLARTPLGALRVRGGEGAWVVVRPERIEIGDRGVKARVLSSRFVGTHTEVRCALAGLEVSAHWRGDGAGPTPGEEARIRITGEVVLAGGEAP